MKSKHTEHTPASMAGSTPPNEAGTLQSSSPRTAVPNIAEPQQQETGGPRTTKPSKSGTITILPRKARKPAGKRSGKTHRIQPQSERTQEYGETLCKFELLPETKATLLMEAKRDIWVVESIDWTHIREKTVRHKLYYAFDLKRAIELAARIESRCGAPEEEVVEIRPVEDEEKEELSDVVDRLQRY